MDFKMQKQLDLIFAEAEQHIVDIAAVNSVTDQETGLQHIAMLFTCHDCKNPFSFVLNTEAAHDFATSILHIIKKRNQQ